MRSHSVCKQASTGVYIALVLLGLGACKSSSGTGPWLKPGRALGQVSRTANPITIFDLSAVMGNDFELARRQLEQDLSGSPEDPALLLRRAFLHQLNLRRQDWLKDMLEVIRLRPNSAPAQFALASIIDQVSPLIHYREEIGKVAEGTLNRSHSSTSVALASALLSILEEHGGQKAAAKDCLKRGGWITVGKTLGPIAAFLPHSLRTATSLSSTVALEQRSFAGTKRVPESISTQLNYLVFNKNKKAGLFVFEAFFQLGEGNHEIDLQVQADMAHRLSIDTIEVISKGLKNVHESHYQVVRLELGAGWHRVRIAGLAANNNGLRLSILNSNGQPVMLDQSSEPKPWHSSVELIGAWPFSESVFSSVAIEQARSKFDALLASAYALVAWNHDLEGGQRILRPIESAAETSVLYHLAAAQLIKEENGSVGRQLLHLRRAQKLAPNLPKTLLQIAQRIQSEDPDEALELCEQLRQIAPHDFQGDLLRHQIFQQRKWFDDADRAYRDALQKPLPTEVLYSILNYFRARKQQQLIHEIEARILKQSGSKAEEAKAAFFVYHNQLEPAEAIYRIASNKDDARPRDLIRMAKFDLARGRAKEALRNANRLRSTNPRSEEALRISISANLLLDDQASVNELVTQVQTLPVSNLRFEEFLAHRQKRKPGMPRMGSKLADRLKLDSVQIAQTALPSRWENHGKVRLLDRQVDFLQADGQALSMTHFLTRILSKEAANQVGEISLSNHAIPLALRTIKASGKIIEVERHAGKKDLSFAALAPFDTIEQQIVSVSRAKTEEGAYQQIFFFQDRAPNLKSQFFVVVPKGMKLNYWAYNGAPKPQVFRDGDSEVYLWEMTNQEAVIAEPYSVSSREYLPFVVVSHGLTHSDARRAYGALYDGAVEMSFDVTQKAQSLLSETDSEREKIEKLYTWLSQEIVSGNSFNPAETLRNKRGNRLTLLKAMLGGLGISAELVLTRSNRSFRVKPPYPDLRKHGILLLRVQAEKDQAAIWIRMSKQMNWFGKVQPDFRDSSYVLVADPLFREHQFLAKEIAVWTTKTRIKLVVDEEQIARGILEVDLPAALGPSIRSSVERIPQKNRSKILSRWVGSLLRGFDATSFEFIGANDPFKKTKLRIKIVAPHFVQRTSDALLVQQFFEDFIASKMIGVSSLSAYIKLSHRKTALLFQGLHADMEIELQFPPTVAKPKRAPKSWTRKSDFGEYSQSFEWDEAQSTARLHRVVVMPAARIKPDAYPDFLDLVNELRLRVRDQLLIPVP